MVVSLFTWRTRSPLEERPVHRGRSISPNCFDVSAAGESGCGFSSAGGSRYHAALRCLIGARTPLMALGWAWQPKCLASAADKGSWKCNCSTKGDVEDGHARLEPCSPAAADMAAPRPPRRGPPRRRVAATAPSSRCGWWIEDRRCHPSASISARCSKPRPPEWTTQVLSWRRSMAYKTYRPGGFSKVRCPAVEVIGFTGHARGSHQRHARRGWSAAA